MQRYKDLLTELLGDSTEHGEEQSYCCPFCAMTGRTPDHSEKLWVNFSKGKFLCYRCETKGTIGYLLRRLGAPEEEPVVQVTELSKRVRKLQGVQVQEPEFLEDSDSDPIVINYMDEIIKNGCRPIEVGSVAWNYLRDRGLTDEDIDFYDIVDGRGRYRNRVVVPTFDFDSNLSYFVARAYRPVKMKTKDGTLKDAPKYLNPKGEGRRHSIFNLNRALDYDTIVITEGVFSAIAAGRNAVATYGKLVTDTQIDLLVSVAQGRELVVCLDGDAHEQTVDVARRLHDRNTHVSFAVLPLEHDPDSIGRDGLKVVLNRRMPYSTLNVAKLQAAGTLRRKKMMPAPGSTVTSSLDTLRRKLIR